MADDIDQPLFDTAAARADGVSDAAIAAFLAPKMGFDLDAARKDGVDYRTIVNFLAPPKAAEPAPQPTRQAPEAAPKPVKATYGDDFKRGLEQTRAGFGTMGASIAGARLSDVEKAKGKADRGEYLSPMEREQARQYGEAKANAQRQLDEGATQRVEATKRANALPISPEYKAFQDAQATGSGMDVVKAFWKAPVDILLSMTAEGLPAMAPALAAGVITGGVGGIAVGAAQGFGQSYANTVIDLLGKRGIDVNDKNAIATALSDPDIADHIRDEAAKGAIPQAIAGGAGMGVGSIMLAPAKMAARPILQQAINIPAQMGLQGAIAAGGEVGEKIALGEDVSGGKAVGAFIGGAAQGPLDVAAFGAHRAIGAAVEGRSPRTPAAVAERVMATTTTDEAIAAAREIVERPPEPIDPVEGPANRVDMDAVLADAQADPKQAHLAKTVALFSTMSDGNVEVTASGKYQHVKGEGENRIVTPIEVWDEKPLGPRSIQPATVGAIRDAYGAMGIDVVFIKDQPGMRFDGAVNDKVAPDTIFISSDPQRAALQVAGHETAHLLEGIVAPDGRTFGELLREHLAENMTDKGWNYAAEMFRGKAPDRASYPAGKAGDADHIDAVYKHILTEFAADASAEAPKLPTFINDVTNKIQARYGDEAAKGVLRSLLDGIKATMAKIRSYFGRSADQASFETPLHDWMANVQQFHDIVAEQYAQKFGTRIEKENADLAAMRNKSERERFLAAESEVPPPTAPAGFTDGRVAEAASSPVPGEVDNQAPSALPSVREGASTNAPLIEAVRLAREEVARLNEAANVAADAGHTSERDRLFNLADEAKVKAKDAEAALRAADEDVRAGKMASEPPEADSSPLPGSGEAPRAPERLPIGDPGAYAEAAGRAATLRRWLGELEAQRGPSAAASPQATFLRQTEAVILGKVNGVEARLTKVAAERLVTVRQQLADLLNPTGDNADMAKVRAALEIEQQRMADAAAARMPEKAPEAPIEQPATAGRPVAAQTFPAPSTETTPRVVSSLATGLDGTERASVPPSPTIPVDRVPAAETPAPITAAPEPATPARAAEIREVEQSIEEIRNEKNVRNRPDFAETQAQDIAELEAKLAGLKGEGGDLRLEPTGGRSGLEIGRADALEAAITDETPKFSPKADPERAAKVEEFKTLFAQAKAISARFGDNFTAKQGAAYAAKMREAFAVRFEIERPTTVEKVQPAAATMSTLAPEIVVAGHGDMIKNKPVYMALADAVAGVKFNADTAIDNIVNGKNPDVTLRQFYDTFEPTRAAMREQYGDTIPLWRAEGLQKAKATTNWATTEAFARQFGSRIVQRDVPIDNVLAVNVTPNGKYHEVIVGEPPAAEGKFSPKQQETPQFKAWFGDSKVLYENGKPRVAYKAMRGTVPRIDPKTGMTHVAFDRDVAEHFGGLNVGGIQEVYVKSVNPFDYRNEEHLSWLETEMEKPRNVELFNKQMQDTDSYSGYRDADSIIDGLRNGEYQTYEAPMVRDLIKAREHDGIYMLEEGQTDALPNLAVFSPTQIKSATGNSGAFDPANPDIRYSPRQKPGPDAPGVGVERGNKLGFVPGFRVKVSDPAPMPVNDKGKITPLITQGTTNRNAPEQIRQLDAILSRHPDATKSADEWAKMQAYAFASDEVPIPPYAFIRDLKSKGAVNKLKSLSEGQIEDANHGFEFGRNMRRAYESGDLKPTDTGKLFSWSFLSRGVSPYTQESLFIDAFKGLEPWIAKAAAGKFTQADLPEYYKWTKTVAPKGSGQPGAGAMHNLNGLGKYFLLKMAQPHESGVSNLQYLHNLMADPDMTGKQIRREFMKIGEGVGIDNKVVSFTLLVAGHNDVMVIDRVQTRQLWNDGRFPEEQNIYDGQKVNKKVVTGTALSNLTYGVRGLLVYEAIERGLQAKIRGIYAAAGRPQDASIGRYHWESWVAYSEQEASHGTLNAILADAKGSNNAIAEVTAKQGEYGAYEYGARYGVDRDGTSYFQYETPAGKVLEFSVPAFRAFLEDIKKPFPRGAVPSKFKVTESKNAPWFERAEVNRQRIGDLAAYWSDRGDIYGNGGRIVREALENPVADSAGLGAGARAGVERLPDFDSGERPGTAEVTGNTLFSPRQIETPEFKRWFGDSKVVDPETGKPGVVYHGTTDDFSRFDSAKLGSASGAPSAERAFFFTSDTGLADSYAAGHNAYEGDAAMGIVRFAQWVTGGRYADANEWLLHKLGMKPNITRGENIMPVYLSIKNPLEYDFKGWPVRDQSFNDLIKRAEKQGNDGLIFRNAIDPGYKDTPSSENPSDIYVAFNPEQIKSAIGNRGTFDLANPDIRYSPRDERKPVFYSAVERAVEGLNLDKATPGEWLSRIWTEGSTKKVGVRDANNKVVLDANGDPVTKDVVVQGASPLAGVKPEELKYLGLDDWLRSQSKSVTKAEVLGFIAANKIEVREVMKGGDAPTPTVRRNEIADRLFNTDYFQLNQEQRRAVDDEYFSQPYDQNTKFGTYTLPGGENYRELLLTLPERAKGEIPEGYSIEEEDPGRWAYRGPGISSRIFPTREAAVADANRSAAHMENAATFTSGHWDEPNVLANIRFNDRTIDGKRTLLVEEVQSDWHQAGRKRGYADPTALADAQARYDETLKPVRDMLKRNDLLGFDTLMEARAAIGRDTPTNWEYNTPADLKTAQDFHDAATAMSALQKAQTNGVPDAPFKTTWPELAMKRVLRYAAENGYDKVAWVPGDVQAARYKLSDKVDRIEWSPMTDARTGQNDVKRSVRIVTTDYKFIDLVIDNDGVVNRVSGRRAGDDTGGEFVGKSMSDVVGKDVAEKILSERKGELAGEGLDIGGTGMKAFYDKMLPNITNKLVKKFGAKVEESTIATGAGEPMSHDKALELANAMIEGHVEVDDVNQEYGLRISGEDVPLSGQPDARALEETFARDIQKQSASSKEGAAVHSVDITPAMRDGVMQGQPLFSPRITPDTPEQARALKNVFGDEKPATMGERFNDMKRNAGERAIIATLDRFAGIKKDDPLGYMGLRLANNVAGAVKTFMEYATLKFDGGTYNFAKKNGGVEKLVNDLGPDAGKFLAWVAGHRADKLKGEDRENLFSGDDIAAFKTFNRGQLADPYTLANGKTTMSREAAFTDALKRYHEFNVNTMNLAVESGLISRKVADTMLADPFYVPFYRVDPRDGEQFVAPNLSSAFVKQTAFQKLQGGKENLNLDLWENAASNWEHLISASIRNKNTIPVLDRAVQTGAATKLTSQEALHLSDKEQKANTVWVMKDGEKQYYRINSDGLMAAVTVLEPLSRNPLMQFSRGAKTVLTVGVTSSPYFAIKNLIRDTIQTIGVTPIGWNVTGNLARGFRENNAMGALDNFGRAMAGFELKDSGISDTALSALAGGALMRFGSGSDTGVKTTAIGEMLKRAGGADRLLEGLKYRAEAYRNLINQSEDVNRIALFAKLKDQGLSQEFAAFSAKDIADFTLTGASGVVRNIASVTAFINARAQGLYKVGRAAVDADASVAVAVGARIGVGIAKRVGMAVMAGTLLNLALDAIYDDDPDYQQRTEFDRNSNYWFKVGKTEYRIPMGFEIGAVSRMSAIFIQSFYDKEMTAGRAAKNIGHIVLDNLSMNPTPTIIKPLVDIYGNTRATGGPITTRGMDRLQADARYTVDNTLLARGVSSAANTAMRGLGISMDGPSATQLDYLVGAYGGWLATTALQMGDTVARSFTSEPVRPARDNLSTWTGGIVSSRPRDASRYVNMMYEQADGIEKAYATFKNMIERGQGQEAQDYFKRNQENISKHGLVSAVLRTEGELNKQIRILTNNPDPKVTPEQKRIQIMQLVAAKNQLARQAFGPKP